MSTIFVTSGVEFPDSEIEFCAIRSQGKGGQNVNKVSTAIQLRFDIRASSLPAFSKQKLSTIADRRITDDGLIIIKAQRFRTQEANRRDALERLVRLINSAGIVRKHRKSTIPTHNSKMKRLQGKIRRGKLKVLRSARDFED